MMRKWMCFFRDEDSPNDSSSNSLQTASSGSSNIELMQYRQPHRNLYDAFKHERLAANRRQIRLIQLWPSSPWRTTRGGDTPACTMTTFEADEVPPYIALSYTWGVVSPLQEILINEKVFIVSHNLFNFLNTFKQHESARHHLWIDQLCIDQTNVQERNSQVRMMANIFRECDFVISWLDQSTEKAAQEIKLSQPPREGMMLGPLTRILSNRYFSRLWIVQEVLIARRVHILCGGTWLSWNEIRNAILALSDNSLYHLPPARALFLGKQEPNVKDSSVSESRLRLSLSDCFSRYSNLECENPRDKVYGLLGLVGRGVELPVVDYDKSLQEVYLEAVRIILIQTLWDNTLIEGARAGLILSKGMKFSKRDRKALYNLFRDISGLTKIDALGLKSSESPTSNWWWYESFGERYYYHGNGKFLDIQEPVGTGQNLCYQLSMTPRGHVVEELGRNLYKGFWWSHRPTTNVTREPSKP